MLNGWMKKGGIILTSAFLAVSLAACGGNNANNENNATDNKQGSQNKAIAGSFSIDGSSTVYPISQAMAEEFMAANGKVDVTVNLSGSSNGIKKLISGEIEIADSSRTMKDSEVEELKGKGWEAVKMPVAYDGITIVVNPQNDWASDITIEELKKLWIKDSTVKTWADIREGWPNQAIVLFGPGTASGTFEYFNEAVLGKEASPRDDFQASEDDNTLVTGVAGDKNALGYFGFAYYEENQNKLKALKVEGVAPTFDTINDGTYSPLSRQIYIYPRKDLLSKPEIAEFIKFYMSKDNRALIGEVGYVPLPDSFYVENLKHVE